MAIVPNAVNKMVFFSGELVGTNKVLLTPAADKRVRIKEFHIHLDSAYAAGTAANILLSSGDVANFEILYSTSVSHDGTSASPFFRGESVGTTDPGDTVNLNVFGAGGTPWVGGWIRYELY